jgi:hypothetical protein
VTGEKLKFWIPDRTTRPWDCQYSSFSGFQGGALEICRAAAEGDEGPWTVPQHPISGALDTAPATNTACPWLPLLGCLAQPQEHAGKFAQIYPDRILGKARLPQSWRDYIKIALIKKTTQLIVIVISRHINNGSCDLEWDLDCLDSNRGHHTNSRPDNHGCATLQH